MYDDHSAHVKKKRVGKACDLCRIKKTKCDGKKPCNRCIVDNKICVFTEKKKLREKSHPEGYVDLLETRLDLVTRLLEKIVELATPHLLFLQQLETAPADEVDVPIDSDDLDVTAAASAAAAIPEGTIPINRVVEYLIHSEGLLKNLPMEWERGAEIAAQFDPHRNLHLLAEQFADHKGEMPDSMVNHSATEVPLRKKKTLTQQSDQAVPFSMAQYPLGGLVLALLAPVNFAEGMSPLMLLDGDSDNNLLHLVLAEVLPSLPHPPRRLNLLFLDNFGLPDLGTSPQGLGERSQSIGGRVPSFHLLPKLKPQNGIHKPMSRHRRLALLISDSGSVALPPTDVILSFNNHPPAFIVPDMLVNPKDMMDVDVLGDLDQMSPSSFLHSGGAVPQYGGMKVEDVIWTSPLTQTGKL